MTVNICCATTIALGTCAGGWRIIKTLGTKVVEVRPPQGRIGLLTSGERIAATPEPVEMADRFYVVVEGSRPEQLVLRALDELDVEPDRAVVVATDPRELEAARAAGVTLGIGLDRGNATPEELRLAGADGVVADLQELLGPT